MFVICKGVRGFVTYSAVVFLRNPDTRPSQSLDRCSCARIEQSYTNVFWSSDIKNPGKKVDFLNNFRKKSSFTVKQMGIFTEKSENVTMQMWPFTGKALWFQWQISVNRSDSRKNRQMWPCRCGHLRARHYNVLPVNGHICMVTFADLNSIF